MTTADVGATIRAIETASNANGDGDPAESNPTQAVSWQPPASGSPPTIAGTMTVGQTLSETHGTWANAPTGYSYQWEDCDTTGNNCSPIAGAGGQTYALSPRDAGHTIRVLEVASNPGGHSAPASSAATSLVLATSVVPVTPGTSGTPALGRAKTSGTFARIPVSCNGGPGATCKLTVRLTLTETIRGGKVIATTAAKTSHKKIQKKVVVIGTATRTLSAGQSATVVVSLTGTGRALLKQHHTLKVRLSVNQNGQRVASSTITFKAKPRQKKQEQHSQPDAVAQWTGGRGR